jgi:putative chitinase
VIITGEILSKVVPNLTAEKSNELATISNSLCPVYGIDSADIYHEFIANVAHESGGFRIRKESLNYTRPERLVAVWPTRFTLINESGKKDARQWVSKPKELANLVYGGRMGNIQPGDGANFLGGGFAQITGRDAYTMFTRFVNSRDNSRLTIQQLATLVQTDDKWAFDSALWFFCVFKNLEELAAQDNFREVVRRWNGGFVGIEERQMYYERAKKYIIMS